MSNIAHLNFLAAVLQNVLKFAAHHPNAFDVLIYRAKNEVLEQVIDDSTDVVGSLESQERAIEFETEPDLGKALIFTEDLIKDTGLSLAGFGFDMPEMPGESIRMLIDVQNIPEQSIIQYKKDMVGADNPQIFTRYVHKFQTIGDPPAINIYHTISAETGGAV